MKLSHVRKSILIMTIFLISTIMFVPDDISPNAWRSLIGFIIFLLIALPYVSRKWK